MLRMIERQENIRMLGVCILRLEMRNGIGLTCFMPTSLNGKSYKIMIDGVNCVDVVFKSAIEIMNLKV